MARPLRMEVPDGIYHAWNRGVNRSDIVFDDRDRQLFVDLLQEVIRRFGWILHEFVLMTNHFHLYVFPIGRRTIVERIAIGRR
jgi:REP element-mobilizing transposase RayT